MKINSISMNNQNFGKLVYPRDVKKSIATEITNKTRQDYSRMVTILGNVFFNSENRNIDKFINNLTKAKNAYSRKNDAILERFAKAISLASESTKGYPHIIFKKNNKKNNLIAIVDNIEQKTAIFVFNKNNNIFTFLKNISDAVLGKTKS